LRIGTSSDTATLARRARCRWADLASFDVAGLYGCVYAALVLPVDAQYAVVGERQHLGLVSRVTPVHTAMRNSTRDEGGPFEVDNQVLISSHRKLLWSKAMVVSVAEKPKQDSGRHG
jgi:hypothetical protein